MNRYARLAVEGGAVNAALGRLVGRMLETGIVDGVLVPARQPYGEGVMQTLVTDPAETGRVDPLAPIVPSSSASLLARLTRRETTRPLAAFLRPCEVRAFIELVKLRQASSENVLLVGTDCHGRYDNRDFLSAVSGNGSTTVDFLRAIGNGRGTEVTEGIDVVPMCRACTMPVAEGVDLRLQVIGHRPEEALGLESLTDAGADALERLGLPEEAEPEGRAAAVEKLLAARREFREALTAEYRAKVSDVDGLMGVIASCTNCHNCRVACPVCYCRECVFDTDTFRHESRQYFDWARKRGTLRMPTDTLFYHLTRMAHMSTLCVGCGQCTSACPNDVPVGELMSTVGEAAQAVFDYVPGRDRHEPQPLAHFLQEELEEVANHT
jgi:formate dehydrogenase subunit beta